MLASKTLCRAASAFVLCSVWTGAAMAAAPGVRARGAVQTPADPTEPTSRWYGWQTLLTDASAIAVASTVPLTHDTTSRTYERAVIALASATYLFGGPVVHVAHHNIGTGAGSLALRVGCPLVLGAAGYALLTAGQTGEGRAWAGLAGAVFGGGLGAVIAITVDAAALAYDDAPKTPSALRRLPQHAFVPTASVGPGWVAIGAAGSF